MEIAKHKTLHLIGIGGAGMSAVAKILIEKGYKVTGSDIKETITTVLLKEMGAAIFVGHNIKNLRKADYVVISTAIPEDNVEYAYARQEKIPVFKRAEILNFLMGLFTNKIAVAGTHGKTTTSSFITRMLKCAEKEPTYLIGGILNDYGRNAELGTSSYFVAEADESDGSFLYLEPSIALVNNLEQEHMEYYKTTDNLIDHFKKFMSGVLEKNGCLILNKDDKLLYKIASSFKNKKDIYYYSIDKESGIMAKNIKYSPQGTSFNLIINGVESGKYQMQVHGKHNVYNALATICFGIKEEIPADKILKGISSFSGTRRRFQFIAEHKGIKIFDDYAHHPTEIKTTLEGIKKSFNKRIVCIFQPHRYTRTRDSMDQFIDAFDFADITVITGIYSANEAKIDNVSGQVIVDKMLKKNKKNVLFIEQKSAVARNILSKLQEGDIVITMGAGDISTVAKEIYAQCKTKEEKKEFYIHCES
ncbi:MAG: UDP-N-acetylmuramate--L-alanine ligase [bacterium]|nr:UDP-N-acetylmuramate--L-alanine ligase [bacterium]